MGIKLADRMMNISPSLTLGITAKAKKMKATGIDVVNFGAGEPDYDTPLNIKEAAKKAIDGGFTKYTPSAGIAELKEAICKKFLNDNNLSYKPEHIVVSNGAKHSLYNIFQVLCQRKDEVIIPSPYWVSYPEMVKIASARPVYIQTTEENSFKITKESLQKAITKNTKAFILNSPSNPTGSIYTKTELQFIADLTLRHNFYVISDEIYEKLIYDNIAPLSIASLSDAIKNLTIVVNGVSKSYSMTGWRIGYLAAPVPIADAISNLQDHSTSNPSSISQKAAFCALTEDQKCVEDMRMEFQKRRDVMTDRLNSINGVSCVKPQGAFYCFCDISKLKIDSVVFANRLLEEAYVAVIPGDGFGWPTHIRLSFATSLANIQKGMDRIQEWVKQLQKKS